MTEADFIRVMKWWNIATPQPESKSVADDP
jgi:hypothetical protein